jgi:hypothetical protein
MSILRSQQIDEILNAENKLKRQIMDRLNTQVKQFNESRPEKSESQVINDINIDSNVDKLLQILEAKYNAGETFLYSSFSYDNSNQKLLTQLLSNQDVITLFNKTVNLLNSTTEENSKDSLKLKLLQIKPLIDSISFIIFSIIRTIDDPDTHPRIPAGGGFAPNLQGIRVYFQKFLPRIFTSYSVIRTIQKQLERNSYKPVTVDEINTEFNQFIDDYRADFGSAWIDDADTIRVLDDSIKNRSVQDAKNKRIKQMEQELGGQPLSPEELRNISNMYLDTPLITSNLSEAELKAIADSIYGIGEQLRVERENRRMAGLPPEDIPDEIPLTEQEVRGQPAEEKIQQLPERVLEDIKKQFISSTKPLIDALNLVKFPNTGNWSLATARLIEPELLAKTEAILKYYLSSVNKAPVDDTVARQENVNKLKSYLNIWSRIINKTDDTALTPQLRSTLKNELVQIRKDYKKFVDEANTINLRNYSKKMEESNMEGEPFIFTGQGRPFLFNDENN